MNESRTHSTFKLNVVFVLLLLLLLLVARGKQHYLSASTYL